MSAAELARLRTAFAGEYEITVRHGILWARRTTAPRRSCSAPDLSGLRTGIAANRRLRFRLRVA